MNLYPRNDILELINTLQTSVDHFYIEINAIDESKPIEEVGSSLKNSCADVTNALEKLKQVLVYLHTRNIQIVDQNDTLKQNVFATSDVESCIATEMPILIRHLESLKQLLVEKKQLSDVESINTQLRQSLSSEREAFQDKTNEMEQVTKSLLSDLENAKHYAEEVSMKSKSVAQEADDLKLSFEKEKEQIRENFERELKEKVLDALFHHTQQKATIQQLEQEKQSLMSKLLEFDAVESRILNITEKAELMRNRNNELERKLEELLLENSNLKSSNVKLTERVERVSKEYHTLQNERTALQVTQSPMNGKENIPDVQAGTPVKPVLDSEYENLRRKLQLVERKATAVERVLQNTAKAVNDPSLRPADVIQLLRTIVNYIPGYTKV
jgi:chromosome segregation ATPase